ncbi:DNA polymerase III subunit delta [Caldanaerobius polysaccharolyticus]|uniref:DNA polymerase III subunit delta n=1 Tax=Caldanaerobius polysaccharolyticus TaxID=44256 RepID=UPI000478AA8E|nr:DNA polymerase III subunit delta [Caldanaerobius polysaccharolyticus]
MFLDQLDRAAKSTNSGFYMLTGEEEYLIDLFLHRISEKYDEVNITVFGEKAAVQDVIDTCENVPFFSEGKLVVVKGSVDDEQALADYVKELPSFTCLICAQKDVDKRKALYKAAKKWGTVYEFEKLKPYEVERWLVDYAARKGVRLEAAAASYLVQMAHDLRSGVNCVDVLISFVYPNKSIGLGDVRNFYGRLVDDNIFDFIDSVQRGSGSSAKILTDLIGSGVNSIYILSMLEWQYRLLIKAKLLLIQGVSGAEERLGVHKYAAKKALDIARRYNLRYFIKGMRLCLAVEHDVKTGAIKDEWALEVLLAKLISDDQK